MALYFGGTALLLHGDGTNGSTTFTDVTGKTVTPYGNAQISTAQSKFGGASIYLDGSSAVRVPDYTTVEIGVGDFTAEAWARLTSFGALNALFGDILWQSGYQGGWLIAVTSAGALQLVYDGNSVTWTTINSADSLFITNTWHHVAVVRCLGIQTVYLDGVSVISFTNTKNYTTGRSFRIGEKFADGVGYHLCTGYIDDIRVINGRAIYTANFTPPDAPLAVTTGTPIQIQPHTTFGPPLSHYNPAVGKPVMQAKVTNLTDQIPYGIPNTPIVNNVNPWEFKGRGRITGTVKNTPATPVRRLLRLYREPGGLLVNSIWSDPDTGAYTFNNLHMGYRYTVVSFDHTQAFRAVVADRVIPEVIP